MTIIQPWKSLSIAGRAPDITAVDALRCKRVNRVPGAAYEQSEEMNEASASVAPQARDDLDRAIDHLLRRAGTHVADGVP